MALLVGRSTVGLLVRGRGIGVVWCGRVLLASLSVVGLRRILLLAVGLLRGITALLLTTAVVTVTGHCESVALDERLMEDNV